MDKSYVLELIRFYNNECDGEAVTMNSWSFKTAADRSSFVRKNPVPNSYIGKNGNYYEFEYVDRN